MKKLIFLLILIMALLLAGCTEKPSISSSTSPTLQVNTSTDAQALKIPTAPKKPVCNFWQNEPAKKAMLYYYGNDHQQIAFDENGNEIDGTFLNDISTNEPSYLIKTRNINHISENGNYYTKQQALFTLDGECLFDYSDNTYSSPIGDFLICMPENFYESIMNDMSCQLINAKTGEVLLYDACTLTPINNNTMFIVTDTEANIKCIIDKTAQIVAQLPTDTQYYHITQSNNIILAKNISSTDSDNEYCFLDKRLNVIKTFYADYLREVYYTRNFTDYIVTLLEKEKVAIFDDTGNMVTSFPIESSDSHIKYIDNYMAIISEQFAHIFPDKLVNLKGEMIAGGKQIEVMGDKYVVADIKKISIINNNGKTEASYETDYQIDNLICMNNRIIATSPTNIYWVFNERLEYVVPPAKYVYIGCLAQDGNHILFQATYKNPLQLSRNVDGEYNSKRYLIDILDENGNVIFSAANKILSYDYNRILLIQGFKLKIIDFCGNVIAEHSLFDEII